MNVPGAILKPVRHLTWTSLILAAALPSCVIYDQALIDEAAEDVVQTGGGSMVPGGGGSVEGGGGTGGVGGTGGEPATTGGAGGSTPATGGNSSGGEPAGTGGGDATGGMPSCDEAPGDFSNVGTLKLIDDFNTNWPTLTNSTAAWDGSWTTNFEDGLESSLVPQDDGPTKWLNGEGYEAYACDTNNLAMHISGAGSTEWGIAFAAKLRSGGQNVDLSAFDGVVFWARSSNNTSLGIGWTDEDNELTQEETPVPPLGTGWKQYKVRFPAAADESALSIVKLLGRVPSGSDEIDIWIDDLTLYAEPAAN